jgi:DNA polymerase delta subunit 2
MDVMPGRQDPGSTFLPQQPLHALLLPLSQRYTRFNRAPNPHHLAIGGVTMLGHSGQLLDNLLEQCEEHVQVMNPGAEAPADGPSFGTELPPDAEARLNALENTLRWQHIGPTTPDGLACYPFVTDDPFVLEPEDAPHVLFAGNQPCFGARSVSLEGSTVKIVLVPSFAKTSQAVLLDLDSLEATTVCFSCPLVDSLPAAETLLSGYNAEERAIAQAIKGTKLRRVPVSGKKKVAEEEEEEEAPPALADDEDDDDEDDDN